MEITKQFATVVTVRRQFAMVIIVGKQFATDINDGKQFFVAEKYFLKYLLKLYLDVSFGPPYHSLVKKQFH